jgi:hypothetical protein
MYQYRSFKKATYIRAKQHILLKEPKQGLEGLDLRSPNLYFLKAQDKQLRDPSGQGNPLP